MEFDVAIPSPLRSYTKGAPTVRVAVATPLPTLRALLDALDRDYPGIRFRVFDEQRQLRPHIQVFVNSVVQRDPASELPPGAKIMFVAALSGG
jgi:molybdopterin converting factor small subunit